MPVFLAGSDTTDPVPLAWTGAIGGADAVPPGA
jgi:hypothetical protein